jgi:hypothetical protein
VQTKTPPRKATKTTQRTKAKTTAPSRPARSVAARRADYGAPVDGFFAKQPPPLRAILDHLRSLVEAAAPDATATLKWGMPFFTRGDEMMCALAAFKSHVNLILPGPPGTYADPDGRLEGDGKTGKHLKLRSVEELPRATVRGWLRTRQGSRQTAGRRGGEALKAFSARSRSGMMSSFRPP